MRQGGSALSNQLEAVALVASARRELLLSVHRHRLGREDLEDCFSQATLELLARARRERAPFASRAHVANALEQRLLSRIQDRQRAISGRSPMEAALFRALPLGDPEHGDVDAIDIRIDLERLVTLRHELRRISEIADRLTDDQRLVLASQLAEDMAPAEFCEVHGWTLEKYRKVAQRARARLQGLVDEASVPQMGVGRMREQGPTYEHISPPA